MMMMRRAGLLFSSNLRQSGLWPQTLGRCAVLMSVRRGLSVLSACFTASLGPHFCTQVCAHTYACTVASARPESGFEPLSATVLFPIDLTECRSGPSTPSLAILSSTLAIPLLSLSASWPSSNPPSPLFSWALGQGRAEIQEGWPTTQPAMASRSPLPVSWTKWPPVKPYVGEGHLHRAERTRRGPQTPRYTVKRRPLVGTGGGGDGPSGGLGLGAGTEVNGGGLTSGGGEGGTGRGDVSRAMGRRVAPPRSDLRAMSQCECGDDSDDSEGECGVGRRRRGRRIGQ